MVWVLHTAVMRIKWDRALDNGWRWYFLFSILSSFSTLAKVSCVRDTLPCPSAYKLGQVAYFGLTLLTLPDIPLERPSISCLGMSLEPWLIQFLDASWLGLVFPFFITASLSRCLLLYVPFRYCPWTFSTPIHCPNSWLLFNTPPCIEHLLHSRDHIKHFVYIILFNSSKVGLMPIPQMRKASPPRPSDLPKATQRGQWDSWGLNPGLTNSNADVNAKHDSVLSLVWI